MSRNHDDFDEHELVPAGQRTLAREGRLARRGFKDTAELVPAPRRLAEASPFSIRPAGALSPHRSICLAMRPDEDAAQQYRMLRYKLKDGANPRLIGVTSAVAGEGKTTVAANLALALAENRQVQVMLLDLNLRSPALGRRFGLSLLGSLADQLRLRQRDPEARWEVLELQGGLHLMAGGEPAENPSPLINSDQMGVLLNDLAARYDYVVVDLPAALAAADAGSLQDYLDTLLLVCRAGYSRRSDLSTATSRLGQRRLHGVLMLDVEGRFAAR